MCCLQRTCRDALTEPAAAGVIVQHLLAQPSTYKPMPGCRISIEDQANLAVFSQSRPAQDSGDERLLLGASVFAFVRKAARTQIRGYKGLCELDDFDQEGARVVLELAKVFDPSIARAFVSPLDLRIQDSFDNVAGQLERQVALSRTIHRRMRGVSWRIHDEEIRQGRRLKDKEWQATIKEVTRGPVSLDTARAYRRFSAADAI